jgi:hypothetical protein
VLDTQVTSSLSWDEDVVYPRGGVVQLVVDVLFVLDERNERRWGANELNLPLLRWEYDPRGCGLMEFIRLDCIFSGSLQTVRSRHPFHSGRIEEQQIIPAMVRDLAASIRD